MSTDTTERTHHGYEIVDASPWDEGGNGKVPSRIILVKLPDVENSKYVTWRQNRIDGACYWGHYCADISSSVSRKA